jgi:hypothetical protein
MSDDAPSRYDADARRWLRDHPHAAGMMLQYARQAADTGRQTGIGLICERLRWYVKVEQVRADEFKINNNYRSTFARWLIEQDPRLGQFIETRTTGREPMVG